MQGSARIDELRQKFHENPRRYFAPLANEYRKAGDPEQAIAICRAHLAQQPAHMSGHVVYAQALYDAGRIDESRVVFEKALSLDPDNAVVLRQLGDISRQKGDAAEARHWYSRALDADPQDREIAAYIAELTEPLTEPDASAVAPEPVASLPQPVEAEPQTSPPMDDVVPEPAVIAEAPVLGAHEASVPAMEEVPVEESAEGTETFPAPADVAETAAEEPAAAHAEESEPAPVEEVTPTRETEVEIPKTEERPELADMPGFEADEALFAADADIELFPDSSSPFVTRTMADLYARQGYNDQALEVYRKLAADNPDDHEIAARIRELSPAEAAPVADPSPSPDNREEVAATNEFSEPADTAEDFGFTPIGETAAIPDVESAADAPSSDVSDKSPHFSDTDLGGGDEWDADSWGAGFSSEETEVVPFDLMASNDTIQLTADDASTTDHAVSQIEVTGETAAEPAEVETPFRHRADSSLIAETDRTGEFAAAEPPLGILNDAREEVQTEPHYRPFDETAVAEPSEQPAVLAERETEEPAFVAEQSQELEEPEEVKEVWRPEDEAKEDEESELTESEHFVAYSPQPPDDEDLPHYTPVGPTIREFFATLGAYRPPENGSGASYTARAAVPDIEAETQSFENSDLGTEERATSGQDETQSADEFPLVSDAFANLFPDSPVSEEDSKAAFALSGALSSQPDYPASRPVATPPSPAPPVEVQPAATQESEEDIRRFREWLDGLAES